jgi:tRNA pseudouridine55 synthase
MHSALKQEGVRLYELARKGLTVDRPARDIHVGRLDFVSLKANELTLDAHVSKGTYMRVLAEDVGEALGCGAHLIALRRTRTGGFGIEQAVTLDALEAMSMEERDRQLRPADVLCNALPVVTLDRIDTRIFTHGGWVEHELIPGAEYRVFASTGNFLGVGVAVADGARSKLQPVRLVDLNKLPGAA